MKRSYSREEEGADHDSEMMDRLDTANCLMLLGRRSHDPASRSPGRVFECKTCNRQFQSFQALGGHRASHKRAKLVDDHSLDRANNTHTSPKVHECAICGTEFAMGQALGGHMRRHRAEAESFSVAKKSNGTTKRLYLDLNLPPSEMDGDFLGIGLVGKFPMVH